jgi:RNA recognition motif-containing protein
MFSTPEEAANALELNGIELHGFPIRVRPAFKRSESKER